MGFFIDPGAIIDLQLQKRTAVYYPVFHEIEVTKFDQHQVFEFIRDCFDIFHVEGDDAIWEDIVPYLKVREYVYV